ncbi:hypothetical protein VNO78_13797 [Psophocarpus tetragonolobus]|uniref:Uncharacterized protein n=1 Tax=Psophocarpus tetragonolobus TaxID=3891 RepID=A0AAN9SQS2_PSOTE
MNEPLSFSNPTSNSLNSCKWTTQTTSTHVFYSTTINKSSLLSPLKRNTSGTSTCPHLLPKVQHEYPLDEQNVSGQGPLTELPLLNDAVPNKEPTSIHLLSVAEGVLLDQDHDSSPPLPGSSLCVSASPPILR